MFPSLIGRVMRVSVLGAGALLAGYPGQARAANPETQAPATQPAQQATCPYCRQVVETAPMSSSQNQEVQRKVMQCVHCTNAVTNFLTKGEFKHTCTVCGGQVDEWCARHGSQRAAK